MAADLDRAPPPGAPRSPAWPRLSVFRSAARWAAAAVALAAVGYFVFRSAGSAAEAWTPLAALRFRTLALAFAGCVLALALDTVCWRFAVNLLVGDHASLSFVDAFGVLNLSNLAKYVPGKVWAYGLQAYALRRRSIPPTVVVQANLALSLAALLGGGLIACVAVLVAFPNRPLLEIATGTACMALLALLGSSNRLVRLAAAVAKRILRRDVVAYAFPPRAWIILVAAFILDFALLGAPTALLAFDMGVSATAPGTALLLAATAASWILGYVAFFTPGGLGAREGALVLMLRTLMPAPTAAVLAICTRALLLGAELLFAAIALVTLVVTKVYVRPDAPPPGA